MNSPNSKPTATHLQDPSQEKRQNTMTESVAELPFEAFDGDEPYVFVSYSHKDKSFVYPEIGRLNRLGFRIWYDEGIDPGNEWPEEVAMALDRCSFFLVFVSPRAVDSQNVRNEINFAINHKKPFLAVHIEDTALPKGLELRMGDIQAVFNWRMSDDRYYRQIEKALPDNLRIPQAQYKKHLVYISHDERRRELVNQIVAECRRLNIDFWEYKENALPGDDLEESNRNTEAVIARMTVFVLLLSNTYEQRPSCLEELGHAISRGEAVSIIPFLVGDRCSPNPALQSYKFFSYGHLPSEKSPSDNTQVVIKAILRKIRVKEA